MLDKGSVPRVNDCTNIRGATFHYTDPRHAKWAKCKDVWFQGTFNNGYADDMIPVASIDPETKTAKLNFKRKDDSVVFRQLPNFKPIPFEKIGLCNDEHRKAGRPNRF